MASGACSGTECGTFATIAAMLGVLTGLVRTGSRCDSVVGEEVGGVGHVSVTAGGRFAAVMGDSSSCDALESLF